MKVSNIVDGAYLGTMSTLKKLAPLLQDPSTNSCATLVALFMNAAHEMEQLNSSQGFNLRSSLRQVRNYIPLTPAMLTEYHPMMVKIVTGRTLFQDKEQLFKAYSCTSYTEVE